MVDHPENVATVTVQEAMTHFSALIARAEAGEEITVAREGRPIVKLVPVAVLQRRTFGGMTLDVPDDFDAPLPEEELAEWE